MCSGSSRKKIRQRLLLLILVWFSISSFGLPTKMWELFASTHFEEKLNRSMGMHFYYPRFTTNLLAFQGKIIELEGFYIPLDLENSRTMVLSKYPMAECFFCGGSGPESIALVHLKTPPGRRLKMDQIVRVKGTLKLNATNVKEMTFIISNAEFISN